ncbi:MAG: ABC transporter permease [Candidatus Lokiarchaeota archaeon]|nr:ABC transporter permease [Candidatus Lokiarchaeota archaeon]
MNISGLVRKELGRLRSDKRTLILLFAIPLILIIIFGLTSGGGPSEFFRAAIITKDDMDCFDNFPSNSTEYDNVFVSVFQDNLTSFGLETYYNVSTEFAYNNAYIECERMLKNEIIDVFILLPENFSETIENDVNTDLIYFIDASNLQAVKSINVSMLEPIAQFKLRIGKTANFTMIIPYLEFEVPFWESQVLNYAFALTIPLIIIGTTMNLSCLSIVSEGPLPRMLITPTSKRSIILSKLIANSLIMILQAGEIFVATAIFGLYCLGSLYELFLVFLAIGLCGVSMGLFISSISKTDQQANQLYLVFFIIVLLFSGQFVSVGNLPPSMQAIIYSFPLGHGIPLTLDITLKGLPMNFALFSGLLIISAVYVVLAYSFYLFKKVEV